MDSIFWDIDIFFENIFPVRIAGNLQILCFAPVCTPLIGKQDILSKSLFAVYISLNLNSSSIAVFIKTNFKDNLCPTQTLTELK